MSEELPRRGDIDGLRSLAILPILLFHAGVTVLPGGFVGVDIFFVISGYLITAILVRDIEGQRFSLARFYRRRILRIFPALFAMLAIVLGVGVITMMPIELAELAQSTAATAAFVSNFYFWKTANYFASAAAFKPLLHTWSLAVEEQFYLFYPLLLLTIYRAFAARLRALLTVISISSFATALWLSHASPTVSFYLLPTRVWELGLGGLVALGLFPAIKSQWPREALCIAGLVLILASVALIREDWVFPAPWALAPCLGAATMLAYGQNSLIAQTILAAKPLRWIGLISYSLYLWHWPVVAFYRLETGLKLDSIETALLIAACLLAGTLSYYVIEQPLLRAYRQRGTSRAIIGSGLGVLGATLASALLVIHFDAWSSLSPDAKRIARYGDYRAMPDYAYQFRRGECFLGEGTAHRLAPHCLDLRSDGRNIIVLGDSHAAQYWRAIALRYPDHNVIQANSSGCRPTVQALGPPYCLAVVNDVLGPLLQTGGVQTVVLAARWKEEDVAKLPATIRAIQEADVQVVVIGPSVEYEGEFPQILARMMSRGQAERIAEFRDSSRKRLSDQIQAIVTPLRARFISAYDLECPHRECQLLTRTGAPYHFDYGHFTLSAARELVAKFPDLSAPVSIDDSFVPGAATTAPIGASDVSIQSRDLGMQTRGVPQQPRHPSHIGAPK